MATRNDSSIRASRTTLRLASLCVVIAACSSRPERNGPLLATEIDCFVAKGAPLGAGGDPLEYDLQGGHLACKRALELFLEAHPDERIASVVPIEDRAADRTESVEARRGTQRLVVVHTPGAGPWSRAAALAVREHTCIDSTSPVGALVDGPTFCDDAITTAIRDSTQFGFGDAANAETWFALTDDMTDPALGLRTRYVLYLARRKTKVAK